MHATAASESVSAELGRCHARPCQRAQPCLEGRTSAPCLHLLGSACTLLVCWPSLFSALVVTPQERPPTLALARVELRGVAEDFRERSLSGCPAFAFRGESLPTGSSSLRQGSPGHLAGNAVLGSGPATVRMETSSCNSGSSCTTVLPPSSGPLGSPPQQLGLRAGALPALCRETRGLSPFLQHQGTGL